MKKQLAISDADKKILLHLLNKYLPNTKAWAYGSRVAGKARPASDLDLVVFASKEQSPQVGDLREAFEESDLTFRVDLFVWDSVPESFKVNIEKEHVVLFDVENEDLQEHIKQHGIDIFGEMRFELVCIESLASTAKNALSGGPFGSNLVSRDYTTDGIPVIRGQNMGGKWVGGDFAFVSNKKASTLAPNKARPGDLVFTQRGTLGQVSIVPPEPFSEYVVSQSQMKLTSNTNKAHVEYLYYVFCSREQQEYIQNNAIQTGVPHTNLSILKRTPIFLPSLPIQQKIASILGTLDDRIQLLRETNATLEAMAQALFKSWFVDFDPVHAKAEGRTPEGMDAETAALFPAEFEESELGTIPKGWKVCTLKAASAYLSRGLAPKYIESGGVTVLNQKCIRNFAVDTSKSRRHDSTQRKITGRELLIGDVLINSTGVGTLGRVAQVLYLSETTVVDSHVTVVRANSKCSWHYLGLLLMRRQAELEAMGEGTTGQTELGREQISQLSLITPCTDIMKAFDARVEMLRHRLTLNTLQMETLTALRDTLLPRLISGKLRLPEFANATTTAAP